MVITITTKTTKPSLIVGICGGSASGKSWLASYLKDGLKEQAVIVSMDWYYKDHGHLDETAAFKLNFDHPRAVETALLMRHLRQLAAGKTIAAPIYDYRTHARSGQTRIVDPAPVIILEGLFVLHTQEIVSRLDLSVYVDVPADERLLRRLRRDFGERRVAIEETLRLYERDVRPMHEKIVEPSASRATWRWRQREDRSFPKRLLVEIRSRLRSRA